MEENSTTVFLGFPSPAEDVEAECESSPKVFRYQKVLQATSFHLLAAAIGKSPSVLGTIDASKAQKVARLSGAAWPVRDPKVPPSIKFLSINVSSKVQECHRGSSRQVIWWVFPCRKWREGCNSRRWPHSAMRPGRPTRRSSPTLRTAWSTAASRRPTWPWPTSATGFCARGSRAATVSGRGALREPEPDVTVHLPSSGPRSGNQLPGLAGAARPPRAERSEGPADELGGGSPQVPAPAADHRVLPGRDHGPDDQGGARPDPAPRHSLAAAAPTSSPLVSPFPRR